MSGGSANMKIGQIRISYGTWEKEVGTWDYPLRETHESLVVKNKQKNVLDITGILFDPKKEIVVYRPGEWEEEMLSYLEKRGGVTKARRAYTLSETVKRKKAKRDLEKRNLERRLGLN